MFVSEIMIAKIEVGERLRPLSEPDVQRISESISKVGLLSPILITRPKGVTPHLVAGYHRLEACRRLGWETIPTVEVSGEDAGLHARMAEIAENLHRAELNALQRSEHVAEWLRLAERIVATCDSSSKPGPRGTQRAAARELGIDKDAANRAVKIDSITPEAKREAEAAGLTISQKALLEVAKAHPDRQVEVVREIQQNRALRVDGDVKERAAKEVAEILSLYVPPDAWDGLKANLYAADAKNIANAFTNLTGNSVMDRNFG